MLPTETLELMPLDEDDDAPDATREEVVAAIVKAVTKLRWRIREDDKFFIILLPPLARPNPARNKWPDEPEEGFESKLRGKLGELRESDD